jgi:hypothetical protein
MNKLCPDDIEFVGGSHLSTEKYYHSIARCDTFGIQMETITRRDTHGNPGSAKRYYFIDKISKEYTNINDLCDDWNKIHDYDKFANPLTHP